jgi:hypothetical protein
MFSPDLLFTEHPVLQLQKGKLLQLSLPHIFAYLCHSEALDFFSFFANRGIIFQYNRQDAIGYSDCMNAAV